MATLWETIIANSTLSISNSTTLLDHLNNQAGGSSGVIYNIAGIAMDVENNVYDVEITPSSYIVEINNSSIIVEVDEVI